MPRKSPAPPAAPAFTPVRTRRRHDGWTAERQLAFIDALAQSGCVHEACRSVGISREAAYRLRARIDAQGFRMAWDAALDYAIRRLSDEVYSRALNGVAVPHFYKGEQVGEHRRYDERLALFLLRYRDPLRYAATLDQMVYSGHVEHAAIGLSKARDRLADEAHNGCATEEPLQPPYARRVIPGLQEIRRQAAAAEAERRRSRPPQPSARDWFEQALASAKRGEPIPHDESDDQEDDDGEGGAAAGDRSREGAARQGDAP